MLFSNALDLLKQVSSSKIGATPSNGYLRFARLPDGDTRGDTLLSILESSRRTFSLTHGAVEFMFYEPNPGVRMIALRGLTAESVAYFDFAQLAERISLLAGELLGEWQPYTLTEADVLYPIGDKVVEIRAADLHPLSGTVLVKAFTFGEAVGAKSRATTVAHLILDLLRHSATSGNLPTVRCSDAASIVIIEPRGYDALRTVG